MNKAFLIKKLFSNIIQSWVIEKFLNYLNDQYHSFNHMQQLIKNPLFNMVVSITTSQKFLHQLNGNVYAHLKIIKQYNNKVVHPCQTMFIM
ncbi:hypothetical protein pb186bvf_020685 [Paramecium bursaria]